MTPVFTFALVRKRLKPVERKVVTPETLQELIGDLDSGEFERREAATRELEALGKAAGPALRKALEGKPSLEMRRRIERLLAKLKGNRTPPKVVQSMRAVEVLERVGTAEARQLLKTLAGGDPQARLTREAAAALGRLKPTEKGQ